MYYSVEILVKENNINDKFILLKIIIQGNEDLFGNFFFSCFCYFKSRFHKMNSSAAKILKNIQINVYLVPYLYLMLLERYITIDFFFCKVEHFNRKWIDKGVKHKNTI